jgi:CheY-like chemotaxis protein
VKADPGQLEQVIVNLALNARDAMPTAGKLTLETAEVVLGEADVQAFPEVRPGPYRRLCVSDTGSGIDAKIRSHLFEPFFTTKEVGKGTGLGLATVYGIVKQSDGHIVVESEVGRGTTFTVFFPPAGETPTPAEPARTPPALPPGTETVLLVEDEEGVRRLRLEVLRMCGYTVLEARHGAEALQISTAYKGPIHLLVTDVVMPRLGGRELAHRLGLERPNLKVLYLTGYSESTVLRQGVAEGTIALLPKPFTPRVLACKVREVLDQKK